MPEQQDMQPDQDYLRQLGYEPSDVAYGAIAKWIIALFIFIGVATAIITVLYFVWVPRGSETRQQYPELTVRQFPPSPRIQSQPVRDMIEFRQTEQARLDSYGPADRNAGTVHIPIDRAVDLTAQRGLPSRTQASASPDAPNEITPNPQGVTQPGAAPDAAETGGVPRGIGAPIASEFSSPASSPAVPAATGTTQTAPRVTGP